MKKQINILSLVYPPISNREIEWLKNDNEIAAVLEESNLYMICQKSNSIFDMEYLKENNANFSQDYILNIQLRCGNILDNCKIHLKDLILKYDNVSLEIGLKEIRIWKVDKQKKPLEILEWYSSEKILWDKYKNNQRLEGLTRYKEFTKYFVHYIGISKTNSLERLTRQAHLGRTDILSKGEVIDSCAQFKDELLYLFFKLEDSTQICSYKNKISLNSLKITNYQILIDAEKALIHILEPQYNKEKYKNYPRSVDGLYKESFTNYKFIIGEDITLFTETNLINGNYDYFNQITDTIFVSNNKVDLIKSDFEF